MRWVARVAAVLLTGAVLVNGPATAPAQAADGRDFDPGNIISDAVFFDRAAMNAAQVQAFLNERGKNCVAGEQPCLKNYVTTTVAKAADAYCSGYPGGQPQTAAQIIAGVAQSCGVNPKVLIVLLEKEQSLVTRTRPTTYAYQRATGFGCPDTAPCNEQYFGLQNQLYLAARQYQVYAANPTRYNHRAGRTNNIRYSPNAACGTSPVYIVNQATAGLYNYTPYQPNKAALDNLYGIGDGCSAYGNRNFWRLFTDWFGSTQGGYLLRTSTSSTVFLVSDGVKYPVPSSPILQAFSALGPVVVVSQDYLDRRAPGPVLGRVVSGPDGKAYLVDGGRRYTFASCDQVADFGSSCAAAQALRLNQLQIDQIPSGGQVSPAVQTSDGRLYLVRGGVKREAVDTQALAAIGVTQAPITLSADAVAAIPLGDPVLRPGVVVTNRASNATLLSAGSGLHPVSRALIDATALGTLPKRSLDAASLAKVTTRAALSPFVRDPRGTVHMLVGTRQVSLSATSVAAPTTVTSVSDDVLAHFESAGAAPVRLFVRAAGGSARYLVERGVLRPVRSDAEALALNDGAAPAYVDVAPGVLATLPTGADAAATEFSDVRVTSTFASDITWLVQRGIATGYDDGTFRPSAAVSRQAMAAFLHRALGSPSFAPPTTPTFADVPPSHPFYLEIEWLAAQGITTGTAKADGTVVFQPGQSVSREAMAAFIYRATGSPAFTAPTKATFVDVPAGAAFHREIEWLATQGITTGTAQPDGTVVFQPGRPVSREAMAAFLHRAARLLPFTPPATPTFADVPKTHPSYLEIEWLAAERITTGSARPDGTVIFQPADPVTRQATAAFLYRAAGTPAFVPPTTPTFADVPTNHPFYLEIEWLAAEGIATGTAQAGGGAVFRPGDQVTREAMAAFLHRAAGSPQLTPPATPTFADVPTSNAFYRQIEWLASEGIATAGPGRTFSPRDPVTREAMAVFLYRAR